MPCNRLYIPITFHNNLTEAKIANELIISVLQSLNHQNYPTKSCLIFGQTLDATDFSCAVSGFGQSREVKYYCR